MVTLANAETLNGYHLRFYPCGIEGTLLHSVRVSRTELQQSGSFSFYPRNQNRF